VLAALVLAVAAAQDPTMDAARLDVEKLLAERRQTLVDFRDPHRSPYAAIDRRDFAGSAPLSLGSAADCDLRLEGTFPHHARMRVDGESFLVDAVDEGATVEAPPGGPVRKARLPPGASVAIGRYTARLSHQNFPAVVLLDPHSPKLREGPPPRWFDPDPSFRIVARLERDPFVREEVVLSTRGNRRRAQRLGRFAFSLAGQNVELSALRLLEPGVDEAGLSIFFRDVTTGHETYPVGRYLEPEPVPGSADLYVLDFNRAYNPTCAFSPHYNCPIPPRENVLPVPIRAGERDPGH
jgi:uncharacterized protein